MTCRGLTANLVGMRFARTFLMAVLAVALTAYAFDCGAGMATPEQAMQCCNSMPCSPHGHDGQDCCKTMPAMHAPFVQPSVATAVQPSLVALATLAASGESRGVDWSTRTLAELSHAPPNFYSVANLPLRI